MARYIWIKPMQEPEDMGVDAQGRARYAFNVLVKKTPSTTYVEELAKILETAGLGALDSTIFGFSTSKLPDAPRPGEEDSGFITIRTTGGTGPENTHNETARPAYPRPGAQINAYATDPVVARAKADAAYAALAAVRNQVVVVT